MFYNKIFGTDGIRGIANEFPIMPEQIVKLAVASASYFLEKRPKDKSNKPLDHRFTVVIAKDTRLSGYMIESALVSGLVSMGCNVTLLGPLPTPAVSIMTRTLRADLGIMISASHNPYQYNGLKFFNSEGEKLSIHDEENIEKRINACSSVKASPALIGRAIRLDDSVGRYIEFAKATFPRGKRLDGLKIVIDCAHGASYKAAPRVLWELGADVISIGDEPDGLNINEKYGALDTKNLQTEVLSSKADLGIALDGDGDRLVVVDEKGKEVQGDQLIALIATIWQKKNSLKGKGVVGTIVTNLGCERYLNNQGLTLYRSNVGDRYVANMMREKNCNIGGEQSGHIIFSDYTVTGDGLISALQILSVIQGRNSKVSEILSVFNPVPQITQNVPIKQKIDINELRFQKIINEAKAKLNTGGYLVVRASGTEPVIRIMAQGDDKGLITDIIDELVTLI
ncbi:MAG: phosphoglucosamine mutase [Alphaproteobacteria bacterium]